MTLWSWPQWLILILGAMSVALAAWLHGEPRVERWDVRTAALLIGSELWILWMGRFFS